ncbi:2-amino-4-hydroxy-6-hydroxymethyldihydropteridine diphosphokinase [Thioclava sp. A2]|uniref:2-amino-4-hydroxy-6- hydroxymethyldihydropteridine diphosphokinase n=1 Tax=Thioclava sp. FCG-A2 TaxID=3080562 RepID=UPI002953C35B|nr:2-amino-4-hydroxy-6-hydroxymethyldihydropteridine diphosphokinase [Thioclava sp. A2]MDV7271165.1 2-amino-4-hydroxy-6-hydroxymethyldihydropteridine diphosphokinase [Thioclava sp. A2]
MDRHTYQIALGSNLEINGQPPAAILMAALSALGRAGCEIAAISRFYRTPAYPPGSGPEFVNACATIVSGQGPEEVLALLHAVEAELGRTRTHRWEARVVDLDLLACGDLVLPDLEVLAEWRNLPPEEQQRIAPECLILPHPRLTERGFVLIPLMDIAPDWRDPISGKSVAELVSALPKAEKAAIRPVFPAN